MPEPTPPTSQLDWLISTTAMIVLFWSRATRDLLKSFGWGIAALHRLNAATKVPPPRRPPHRIFRFPELGEAARVCFSIQSVPHLGCMSYGNRPRVGVDRPR